MDDTCTVIVNAAQFELLFLFSITRSSNEIWRMRPYVMLTSNSGTYSGRSLHYITFDYYKRVLCYVVVFYVMLSDSAHCKFALQPKSSTLSSFFRDRIACEARIVIFFF